MNDTARILLVWVLGWAGLGVLVAWAVLYLMLRPGISRVVAIAPAGALVAVALFAGGGVPLFIVFALIGSLGGLVAGWLAATSWRFRESEEPLPRIPAVAPDAPRQVAVIYFTHGEPETYDPEPWIVMLHELASSVEGFPPKPIWPFILGGIKGSFDAVEFSPHCRIHGETMEAVRQAVGRDDVRWYVCFLDVEPMLKDAIEQAARDGATDVVFLTVFLTDSDHTVEADEHAAEMGLAEAGIRTLRTAVLWDDPRLARMIADKVIAATGDRDREHVGVMLVGHGQPEAWDRVHPTETEQELAFRSAVRELLIADGFEPELVSDAWMEFREPRVPARVRELAERGARTVVGVPVTISADSLHSLHDTPQLVRKGAAGTEVEVVDVSGWNTDPLLVELLADRARQGDRGPGARRPS